MRPPNPMRSPDEMEKWWTYAKHPDFNVKWSIFAKRNVPYEIPFEILDYLANDTDWVIRVEVASYARTPLEILKRLAVDSAYGVRESVWFNPNCTEELRLLIISHTKYGHLTNRHNSKSY